MSQNHVDAGIVGDLLLGERDEWDAGVCRLTGDDFVITVHGENGHPVGRVDPDAYQHDSGIEGFGVTDLREVADAVNELIDEEHAKL